MKSPFRTARAVIQHQDQFLLAVHSSFWRTPHNRKWGLLGGRIERGEHAADALRRELKEELRTTFEHLTEIGPFHYKRADHMVYGTHSTYLISDYDEMELIDLRWFSLDEVRDLAERSRLHAGYELTAIEQMLAITNKGQP